MTTRGTLRRYLYASLVVVGLMAMGPAAWAGGAAFPVLDIDFEVESLNFGGTGLMPLGVDFSPVVTDVQFTATAGSGNTFATGPNVPVQSGDQLFFENTTMSLVFDIVLTDVDPSANFAGGATSIVLNAVQVDMGDVAFVPNCIADTSQPFFGCGMLLHAGFNDGDSFDVGPTNEGDDYDSLSASVPILLGQDADGMNGTDAITALDLELAFSTPLSTIFGGGLITQTYNVNALLSGSINPVFGDPTPISLSGSATVSTPEPSTVLLLGSSLAWLGWRRRPLKSPGSP